MIDNKKFDLFVKKQIRKRRSTNSELLKVCVKRFKEYSEEDLYRPLDRSLQRLRKKMIIIFKKPHRVWVSVI